jgi:hypothetical protein
MGLMPPNKQVRVLAVSTLPLLGAYLPAELVKGPPFPCFARAAPSLRAAYAGLLVSQAGSSLPVSEAALPFGLVPSEAA